MKLSDLKSDPRVYLGLGIVGMLTGTVLASKATPKAVDILEKKKVVLKKKSKDEVTVIEAAKKTWKLYLPATLMCTASIACLIGSDVLHEKRNTALLAAYQLSSTALAEYKNSVIDTVGEKKEREIKDNLAQKQVSEQHNNKECDLLPLKEVARLINLNPERLNIKDLKKETTCCDCLLYINYFMSTIHITLLMRRHYRIGIEISGRCHAH